MKSKLFLIIAFALFTSCNTLNSIFMKTSPFIENFENQIEFEENWIDNSWKSTASYQSENGNLKNDSGRGVEWWDWNSPS